VFSKTDAIAFGILMGNFVWAITTHVCLISFIFEIINVHTRCWNELLNYYASEHFHRLLNNLACLTAYTHTALMKSWPSVVLIRHSAYDFRVRNILQTYLRNVRLAEFLTILMNYSKLFGRISRRQAIKYHNIFK